MYLIFLFFIFIFQNRTISLEVLIYNKYFDDCKKKNTKLWSRLNALSFEFSRRAHSFEMGNQTAIFYICFKRCRWRVWKLKHIFSNISTKRDSERERKLRSKALLQAISFDLGFDHTLLLHQEFRWIQVPHSV